MPRTNPNNRPSADQVAWVFKHVAEAVKEPGTFRHLIYDRMGFSESEYQDLYLSGGMAVTNALHDRGEALDILRDVADDLCEVCCSNGRLGRKHSNVCQRVKTLLGEG